MSNAWLNFKIYARFYLDLASFCFGIFRKVSRYHVDLPVRQKMLLCLIDW